VFSSAAYYFAIAWGGIEILEWVLGRWQVATPHWLMPLLAAALVVGFPVTMLLAWMYDINRSGIHRTEAYGKKGGAAIALALVLMVAGTGGLYWLIGTPETPDVRLPPTVRPRLAVLPFEAFSTDPEKVEFADAIHFELLNNLSKLDSLMVISRQSVLEYRDSGKPLPAIALELGVNALLTGAVQRSGNRIRISLSLRDGKDDRQVWSDDFEFRFSPDRYFEAQAKVAETITGKFQLELSENEKIRIGNAPTRDLTAFDAYLLGSVKMTSDTVAGAEAARPLFEDAIRTDPDYAMAYVGLFHAYRVLSRRGVMDMGEAMQTMESLVTRALELDNRLAEAWHALAINRWRGEGADLELVDAAFRRALELNPYNAGILASYAYFLNARSKTLPRGAQLQEKALELLRRAEELNPRSGPIAHRIATVLEDMGRGDEALPYAQKGVELTPNQAQAYLYLALIHGYWFDDYNNAWRNLLEAARHDPDDGFVHLVFMITAMNLGDGVAATYLANEVARIAGQDSSLGCQARVELARFERRIEEELECLQGLEGNQFYFADLRDIYIANNQLQMARDLFQKFRPELFSGSSDSTGGLYRDAIDVYPVLIRTGELELADRLLESAAQFLEGYFRKSTGGFGWADVEIHALRGDADKAMTAMREAVDEGLRHYWWHLPDLFNLQSIRDDPRFKAMMGEMAADMAQKRDVVRKEFGPSLGLLLDPSP